MGDLNSHILLTEQQYKQYPLFMDYSYAHLTHLFLHDPLFSSLFQYDEVFFVKIDHFFLDSYETTIGSLFWWLWRTISVLPSDLQIEARNLVLWSLQEESALSTSWLVWWLFSILIAFRCDRVLYYASSSAKCHIHSTTSCPTVFVSDHLPVVSHSTITLSSSSSLPPLSSPSLLDVFDSLFLSFP